MPPIPLPMSMSAARWRGDDTNSQHRTRNVVDDVYFLRCLVPLGALEENAAEGSGKLKVHGEGAYRSRKQNAILFPRWPVQRIMGIIRGLGNQNRLHYSKLADGMQSGVLRRLAAFLLTRPSLASFSPAVDTFSASVGSMYAIVAAWSFAT
jgi:hypothetical protein